MLFCCFGAGDPVKEGPQVALEPKVARTTFGACQPQASDSVLKPSSIHPEPQITALRCQLATLQGPWLSRLQAGVDAIHAACMPVSQVSLFGASPCGTALVLLGSSNGGGSIGSCGAGGTTSSGGVFVNLGATAAALAPGLVLPVPLWWLAGTAHSSSASATPGAAAAAAVAAGRALSTSDDGLLILSGLPAGQAGGASGPGVSSAADTLTWQFPEPAGASPGSSRPGDSCDAQCAPREWRPLLEGILMESAQMSGVNPTAVSAVSAASAGVAAGPWAANGKPSTSAAPPAPSLTRASQPRRLRLTLVPLRLGSTLVGAMLLTVTGLAGSAGVSESLRSGVAAAVAECCLGPHLSDIQKVTAAARDVATAPDLQGLASALSAVVVDTLARELHVDFSMRLAVVPQPQPQPQAHTHTQPAAHSSAEQRPAATAAAAQYGFMLTEQAPPAGGGVAAGLDVMALAAARGSLQGPASRGAFGRVSSQQMAVERLVPVGATGKPMVGGNAATSPHPGDAGSTVHSGAFGVAPLNSGVHSFHLPGPGGAARGQAQAVEAQTRVWKARPFSMESTLLSALSGKKSGSLPAVYGRALGTSLNNIPAWSDDLAPANGGSGGGQQVGLHASFAGAGGGGAAGPYRVRAAAVPHIQAYVNDTDQPSADVMLLFRGRAAAAGAAAVPASMVLVAGSVNLCLGDSPAIGVSASDACVGVGLYLASQDRLPTSLLCAARRRAQALVELLLPAAATCLADSAYAELQYMYEAVVGSLGGNAGSGLGRAVTSTHSVRTRTLAAFGTAGTGGGGGAATGASDVFDERASLEALVATAGVAVDEAAAAATATLWGPASLGHIGAGAAASNGAANGTGAATRYCSDASTRVTRSRLSHATAAAATLSGASNVIATVTPTTGPGINNLLLSTSNLVAALMGNESNPGGGGAGGARSTETSTGAVGQGQLQQQLSASGFSVTLSGGFNAVASAAPLLPTPTLSARVGTPRRALGVPQPALAGSSGGRGGSMRQRQQTSDLLATMPCDVSDALTVMRTNLDVLVNSFWSTLRSQAGEASPNHHADDDLRFLRLTKVLGGGGCSRVYAGLLHGLEVAVKVMKASTEEDEAEEEPLDDPAAAEAAAGGGDADGSGAAPPARQAQLRALMRGARELAVMTSISHPNIVQIYSYHTRVLVRYGESIESIEEEAYGGAAGGGSGVGGGGRAGSAEAGEPLPRLVPVPLGVEVTSSQGPLQTVLVMECCDLGSLADALDSGMFAVAVRNAEAARLRHAPPRRSHTASQLPAVPQRGGSSTGARGGGGGMHAILMTLLEVALALRHMHSMQLVHCDVKPANVLLRSSASDPRGFTCKLTDFGFVNLLQYAVEDADNPQAKPSMRYHEPVGTVTHLAPETMVQGSKLDHTVDIYAFGVLMWEVFTGKAPYAEHATNNFQDVPYLVVRDGMRPIFPSSTPHAFKCLAQACWSSDVSRRPTAAMLVASLQRLMDASSRI